MKKSILMVVLLMVLATPMIFAGGQQEPQVVEAVEMTDPGTYPIVTSPVTYDIMIVQPSAVIDYNTNEFSKYLEEKTGVKINWIMVPEQARAERLSLVLASGDYPDAFWGFDNVTPDMEALYGTEEGLFLPLNEFINGTTMPNLSAALDEFPGSRGFITSTDGNIYSLPRLEACYHCTNAAKMYIYQPFLDALGMEAPKTTEDLYRLLVAIKEQDPNGNGKKDEIPLAGSIVGWNDHVERWIMNAFIYSDLDTNISAGPEANMGYIMDGDKVDTIVNKDAFREGLKFLNKLYREGLIYNGSFTQDSSQLTQLVESSSEPVVGLAAGGWRGMFSTVDGQRFKNFRAIAPVAGPDGAQYSTVFLQNPQTGRFIVSSEVEHPEVLMRWADYFYSMEGTLTQKYGFENDAWAWAEDGDVGLDGEPAIWKQLKPWNDKDPQNVTFIQGELIAESARFRNGQAVDLGGEYYAAANNEKVLYDETHDLYKPYEHTELEVPTLRYTVDETEEFSTVKAELANYIRQSTIRFIVGTTDVNDDAAWNDHLKNLEKLQLSAILENMQTAYDRQFN